MIGAILGWFTSAGANAIFGKLADAYEMKLRAETSEQKLEADLIVARLEAQQEIILAEQGRWFTAWIRPLMALPVVIYLWKIIVYDTVLKLGTTPNPGDFINYVVLTIIGAYFVTRPFEKIFRRKQVSYNLELA